MNISELSSTKSKKFHLDLDKELNEIEDDNSISIETELQSLQDQINSLEYRASSRVSNKLSSSHNSSVLVFLKNVDKTEKEIQKIEKTINKTPVKQNNIISLQTLDEIKARLIAERQNNYLLKKECESLKKKLAFKPNLSEDLSSLQEDYTSLIDSFNRSENIRKKQKKAIRDLKNELLTSEKSLKNKQKSLFNPKHF